MEQRYADYFGDSSESIKRYVDILLDRGITWGVIGPREGERLWERHILNSVAGAGLIPADATVADVGSGAGLPGIPLALLRPDLMMTLVESLARRSAFLEQAVAELGLGERVRVVRSRAEDHRETYDVVVSRAVAPLPKLIGWCAPLCGAGGRVLALKGQSALSELADAAPELARAKLKAQVHELDVPLLQERTWVVEAARR
ncbi:16S rRNA (guanine(527)-N(7))-methyltransferase RsmG [Propionicimonas sp.]|uniref:16S rRNA (guanine(527)-N(7))-methyltransferase RsmG n=1 Tax=Propionicimonas sp. TaxID=1955623 RepID=UPI001797C6C9|nr:16S rRNA (guanine(527)-N(7))-methyltransferase RsmG [Propionicimonas sp.]MBU3976346.1 16S rRNA (guanine(527)-N(7))-methyltransferase RsmG [Actinomycetota bacterium]MBA3022061.1 16S rRNA (guanine(527)-N(7))-methyltransferase RsmG [Propionicimonas sp.]MBU3987503.1 16S rRNA (guanine(527)-N(7))-methyltransferase RsmG [Actinomycetota bacterium]MBU4006552.1 16S rRNA (guanine(527)-N(7))-methyltransferase RsmG [Actinomycetota bacterium]MBU4065157.1 16S rRNA (guanine(527)-N(7))-methyltransferase Rsm